MSDHSIEMTQWDASKADSASEAASIFEQLDGYDDGKNDFHSNPDFQSVWDAYRGLRGIARRAVALGAGLGFAVWLVLVLVYANMKVTLNTLPSSWRLGTNIVLGGENVTLNAYSDACANVTLDDLRAGALYPNFYEVKWLRKSQYPKTGAALYTTRGPKWSFVMKAAASGRSDAIIENVQFSYKNTFFYVQDLILNPDAPVDNPGAWHIVVTDKVDQWRHSSFGLYWLFRPATNEHVPIQPRNQDLHETLGVDALKKLHFAQFAPAGDHVVFGMDHDLYLQDLSDMAVTRITDDGSAAVLNGKTDWVYEEEVTANDKFFWFSPNQDVLLYVKTDDTEVFDFELDYYVKDTDEIGAIYRSGPEHTKVGDLNQYPLRRKIKYPKPGTPNPKVSLFKYDLISKKADQIPIDQEIGAESILYDAVFLDNDNFLLKQTDRTSKRLLQRVYTLSTQAFTTIDSFNATEQFGGWIGKMTPVALVKGGGYVDKKVVGKRTHLVYYETPTSTSPVTLTHSEDWNVLADAPLVYNQENKHIYTLANMKGSMDSHLILVHLDAKEVEPLTSLESDGVYKINADDIGQNVELKYLGPKTPWQKLMDLNGVHSQNDFEAKDTATKALNDIKTFQNNIMKLNLPTRIYRTIKLGQVRINVIEILPPKFSPESKHKHPLLVHAYGGPGAQTVDKTFSVGLEDVVSAQLDAIVLIIDPRGTGGQGWEFMGHANNMIGFWEGRDIINVVNNYIEDNSAMIDAKRVAIWGWSYGGFTTLKTLEIDKGDIFKFGMAVAPVTNWLFYDSIYTERYMNTPEVNPNYSKTARIQNFASFKANTRFLLVHGTADDNVHLQNALWLMDKFNVEGVENYDVHFFPDNDHSILYHNSGVIVYDKLFHWLSDAFRGKFDDGFV